MKNGTRFFILINPNHSKSQNITYIKFNKSKITNRHPIYVTKNHIAHIVDNVVKNHIAPKTISIHHITFDVVCKLVLIHLFVSSTIFEDKIFLKKSDPINLSTKVSFFCKDDITLSIVFSKFDLWFITFAGVAFFSTTFTGFFVGIIFCKK